MPEDYAHDVFISYTRAGPVGPWVRDLLRPQVRDWLGQELGREPRVFIDTAIDDGAAVLPEVRRALLGSRCLLAVWSRPYGTRPWCCAEWQSMAERQRTLAPPHPLILPVAFYGLTDSQMVTMGGEDVRVSFNFEPHSALNKGMAESPRFVSFVEEVQRVCRELARRIEHAPPFRPDFPFRDPPAEAPAAFAYPGPR